MIRRVASVALIALVAVLAACAPVLTLTPAPAPAPAPAVPSIEQPVIAVTVDDIPEHGGMAPGETRLDLTRRLVAALEAEGVPAYGFVNGGPAQANRDDMAALEYWAGAFPIGNHTWTHANVNELSPEDYIKEIARGEPLLEKLSPAGDWHWFRYPWLEEGDDPAKRLAIRQVLASRGYRIAAVTMDFDDWKYADAYARCAVKGDGSAISRLEDDWLDAVRYNAEESRRVAKSVYGGDIPYVLLTHIGSFDARMFPRTLALYREMGFRFVSLDEAQNHPAYASDNDPAAAPQPTMFAMAQQAVDSPPYTERVPNVDLAGICNQR
ncbi:polysaccharide deacetylase family protein [Pseudonocardia charpentierae]|uniref:Polysaccharide deacetylase family protein n=1 Tax=Pseudonocardia charpentierae TaxID=3075545 RepID=A0ABU2NJ59_9PSEU|nr:polysaccharide deacetylase family protein [Pseudonocardia sp. DSM 45834]MDT0353776.1 polysaccharide deacetylase family protein [Pseudonocardia sp. DSM 45834]